MAMPPPQGDPNANIFSNYPATGEYVHQTPLLDPQYASPQYEPQHFHQPHDQQQHQQPQHQQPQLQQPNQTQAPSLMSPQLDQPFTDKNDGEIFVQKSQDSYIGNIFRNIGRRYQMLLDASTPHWGARWAFSIFILLLFMVRIVVAQGWYIICYGLSIYYLNLFIGFLSPKIDPAFQADGDGDDSDIGPMLPTKANDEFRPFIRRLPEFKFWLSATKATLISLFLTLFEVFDMPVFWPILLIYFIILFISTMRQQIKHMIKYGYVPWDKGKKKYGVQQDHHLYPPTL